MGVRMSYESWRISYQSSEQAARAAYIEAMHWKLAFMSARKADYLRDGMSTEQARLHAETDVAMAVAMMNGTADSAT